jgi:hypothetical protein
MCLSKSTDSLSKASQSACPSPLKRETARNCVVLCAVARCPPSNHVGLRARDATASMNRWSSREVIWNVLCPCRQHKPRISWGCVLRRSKRRADGSVSTNGLIRVQGRELRSLLLQTHQPHFHDLHRKAIDAPPLHTCHRCLQDKSPRFKYQHIQRGQPSSMAAFTPATTGLRCSFRPWAPWFRSPRQPAAFKKRRLTR